MNAEVKVIATSGLTLNQTMADVASVGVNLFLPKPYTAQELLKELHTILEKSSEQ